MDTIQPTRRELLGGLAVAALAARLPCAGSTMSYNKVPGKAHWPCPSTTEQAMCVISGEQTDRGIAGYSAWGPGEDGKMTWVDDPGLLTGGGRDRPGIAGGNDRDRASLGPDAAGGHPADHRVVIGSQP